MEIRQLYYFMEVAKERSFSKAAEKLYITQPSISQQISALEKELNKTLFVRTTKKVSLTAEGERFLNPCREVIEAYDRLLISCGLKAEEEKVLHIGVFPLHKSINLSSIIGTFYTEHRDIKGMIKVVENNLAYELLKKGELDVAIIKCRDAALRENFHYEQLLDENISILISRKNPKANVDLFPLADLGTLPLLTGENNSHYYQEMESLYKQNQIPFYTSFQSTLETEMLMKMVEADAGIMLISDAVSAVEENEKIKAIPLDPPQEIKTYLVYPKGSMMSHAAKAFCAYILDVFRGRKEIDR